MVLIFLCNKHRGRSPHGERGLKSIAVLFAGVFIRRSPHGERGLKSILWHLHYHGCGRSPHGERGLKFAFLENALYSELVAPLTGSVD